VKDTQKVEFWFGAMARKTIWAKVALPKADDAFRQIQCR
jgi:hypothetical protein